MKKLAALLAAWLFCIVLSSCGSGGEIVIHTKAGSISQTKESTTDMTESLSEKEGLFVVINKNSMVFHLPDCIYAERMSSENRLEIEVESAEYLLEHGYTPCGKCCEDWKEFYLEESK